MQISPKEIYSLIGILTIIFLIMPLFLIAYVNLYNSRKKRHQEEVSLLKMHFEHELLRSRIEVQEQTFKNIAHDLHDNIGQLMGLTVLTLSSVNLENLPKAQEKINAAEALTKRSIREIKTLAQLLHGEELLHRGLIGAILFELEWLEKSRYFEVTFQRNIEDFQAPSDHVTMLFRLFQEVLNNIIRHANATTIQINLQMTNNILTLTIADNGIGFDVTDSFNKSKGMGLQNMQRRAAMIGGNTAITSSPGAGTSITITIPYVK